MRYINRLFTYLLTYLLHHQIVPKIDRMSSMFTGQRLKRPEIASFIGLTLRFLAERYVNASLLRSLYRL